MAIINEPFYGNDLIVILKFCLQNNYNAKDFDNAKEILLRLSSMEKSLLLFRTHITYIMFYLFICLV